jgi:exodeoxyribonuclease VII large subunit
LEKEKAHIRLSQLNVQIKEIIQDGFRENPWIIAEIGDIKFNRNGHAYLELIEKDPDSNKIVAKASANIWSYTLRMLKPYFETTTGKELGPGLKLLIQVSVEFHELYGFSLNIKDIDPAYTLGDIELHRLQIINRLTDEGILDMNKELDLPELIQRIAVVSSGTAAGYEDFMKQLEDNPGGYKFYCKLFPALMQGEQTETSIIAALDSIFQFEGFFDVVVIIRGGGARSDLMWFDNYNLAYYITQFPLPVISGIGHEKDVSIVDMVSHTSLKTPTAVAEFVISRAKLFDQRLDEFIERIDTYCTDFFTNESLKLDSLSNILVPMVQKKLHRETKRVDLAGQKISLLAKSLIEKQAQNFEYWQVELKRHCKSALKWKSKEVEGYIGKLNSVVKHLLKEESRKLEYMENSIQHFNPQHILKKGYSITKVNGKLVTDAHEIEEGQLVETILYQGAFNSRVEKLP